MHPFLKVTSCFRIVTLRIGNLQRFRSGVFNHPLFFISLAVAMSQLPDPTVVLIVEEPGRVYTPQERAFCRHLISDPEFRAVCTAQHPGETIILTADGLLISPEKQAVVDQALAEPGLIELCQMYPESAGTARAAAAGAALCRYNASLEVAANVSLGASPAGPSWAP